jgi:MbtH protein
VSGVRQHVAGRPTAYAANRQFRAIRTAGPGDRAVSGTPFTLFTAVPPGTSRSAFHVVANDEEQYSVWPEGEDLPPGWQATGYTGSRAECLAHVDAVWTDLRPLSARREVLAP